MNFVAGSTERLYMREVLKGVTVRKYCKHSNWGDVLKVRSLLQIK